jgi:hypothetical protein
MGQNYSLTVYNKSSYSGNVIVYQGLPKSNIQPEQIVPLAWLSEGIEGSSTGVGINQVKFDWTIDYGFVWSKTGVLQPGVDFVAGGSVETTTISPGKGNKVAFGKGNQQYTFSNQTNGSDGKLEIDTLTSVVPNDASIGVTMSGNGVFAVQALPQFSYWFLPHPTYSIALGNYESGQVMDLASLSAQQEIQFDGAATDIILTYNSDGSWSVGAPS